ncbi:MAG: GIY-YIG nuclease family protein [Planctomycetota bacterium]
MIYFIQPKYGGLIKIGYTSKDPVERLRELQTGSSQELELLMTEPGTLGDEKKLHDEFRNYRVRGEWFRPGRELVHRVFRIDDTIQMQKLRAFADSYMSCLWSHCTDGEVDRPTVNLLFHHAKYVRDKSGWCYDFLKQNGVVDINWKHCQYFFSICWPVHKPWMELSKDILSTLIDQRVVDKNLELDPKADRRPLFKLEESIECT